MIIDILAIFLMVFLAFAVVGFCLHLYAIKNPEKVWANIPVHSVRAGDPSNIPYDWQNTKSDNVTENKQILNWVHDKVVANNKKFATSYSSRYLVCEVDGASSQNLQDKELFLTDKNFPISELKFGDNLVLATENTDPVVYKMRCFTRRDKNNIFTTKMVKDKPVESCHLISQYVGKVIANTDQFSQAA